MRLSSIWDEEPDLAQLRQAHRRLATAPAQALEELKSLAERGSKMSLIYIADAYREGTGTNVDFAEAEKWYQRAAKTGALLASYELGRMNLDRKEYHKAEEAFTIGASSNYAPSYNMLGIMYRDGKGVEKNFTKAKDFFERASEHGHAFGKRNLAGLLVSGHFGTIQLARGLLMFVAALKDLAIVGASDPLSDRLR